MLMYKAKIQTWTKTYINRLRTAQVGLLRSTTGEEKKKTENTK
jgi:hypothetical protein